MLAVKVLDPAPGERILDVCLPWAEKKKKKTTHIGQVMKTRGILMHGTYMSIKSGLIGEHAKKARR